jgi:hypothetical protein
MIGTGTSGMKVIGCGRWDRSEEYRLAHNLLKIDGEIGREMDHEIDRDPETLLGQVSLLNSGD